MINLAIRGLKYVVNLVEQQKLITFDISFSKEIINMFIIVALGTFKNIILRHLFNEIYIFFLFCFYNLT